MGNELRKRIPGLVGGAVVGISLLVAGCGELSRPGSLHGIHAEDKPLIRTELFFGLSRPNGADVTADEFEQFLKDEVSVRFPAGFTIIESKGQWREESGRIRSEPSRILVLIHPRDASADRKIEEIRSAFKTRYQQEAILRTDEWQGVSF